MKVYADGDIYRSKNLDELKKLNPESGVVYDSLFVRHWDLYIDPKKYQQVHIILFLAVCNKN
jgi:hypothetical protein